MKQSMARRLRLILLAMAAPPPLPIHENDGRLAKTAARSRLGRPAESGVPSSTLFTIPARDGFPMPAELVKPKDFDTAKEYPVILSVRGGPSAPTADARHDRS